MLIPVNSWPIHVEPLDRAILDLLSSLPPVWDDYNAESLTGSEQEAIRLMVRAGLVDLRVCVRAEMDRLDEFVELVLTVTGEYDATGIWRVVFDQVPDWLDAEGRTRGPCRMWLDPQQVRLTDQGELARHDYENQTADNPSAVCAFVRKTGFFAYRPPVPARIHVESCSSSTRSDREFGVPMNAAAAKATVGDITIHNNIQIDHGAIVEQILVGLEERKEPSQTESEGHRGSEGRTETEPDQPKPKINPSVWRAGKSLEWVRRDRPDLAPNVTSKERYTREQYEHIREHGGGDAYPLDEHGRSTVPAWETWSRYIREYLRLTEGQINFPRRGRTGRSLVRPEEIDCSYDED